VGKSWQPHVHSLQQDFELHELGALQDSGRLAALAARIRAVAAARSQPPRSRRASARSQSPAGRAWARPCLLTQLPALAMISVFGVGVWTWPLRTPAPSL